LTDQEAEARREERTGLALSRRSEFPLEEQVKRNASEGFLGPAPHDSAEVSFHFLPIEVGSSRAKRGRKRSGAVLS
jgi:hypothetical protein